MRRFGFGSTSAGACSLSPSFFVGTRVGNGPEIEEPMMSVFCFALGHRVSTETVWNGGIHFARCSRCGADLCESSPGHWIGAPRGYRIVRRPPAPPQTDGVVLREDKTNESVMEAGHKEAAASGAAPGSGERREKQERRQARGWMDSDWGGAERRKTPDRRLAASAVFANRRRGLLPGDDSHR